MSVGTLKLLDIPDIFDVRARKQQAQGVETAKVEKLPFYLLTYLTKC